ncbi:hypothetical protein ON010_g2925 [Phytophthora cinnamomi]|nr:hypothetical protein ON010_g2925 [Phytophthora cinnamomi]
MRDVISGLSFKQHVIGAALETLQANENRLDNKRSWRPRPDTPDHSGSPYSSRALLVASSGTYTAAERRPEVYARYVTSIAAGANAQYRNVLTAEKERDRDNVNANSTPPDRGWPTCTTYHCLRPNRPTLTSLAPSARLDHTQDKILAVKNPTDQAHYKDLTRAVFRFAYTGGHSFRREEARAPQNRVAYRRFKEVHAGPGQDLHAANYYDINQSKRTSDGRTKPRVGPPPESRAPTPANRLYRRETVDAILLCLARMLNRAVGPL